MPLSGVTYRTVTASFRRMNGDASSGTATFTPSARIVTDNNDIVVPHPIDAVLAAGDISVSLPVNDDPQTSPTGWTWRVDENIDGVVRSWHFALPTGDGSPLDLADVTPVDPVTPSATYVLASSLTGFATDDELQDEADAREDADTALATDIAAETEAREAAIADLSGTYVQHVGNANGTDDTATIQAALTAARVAGGGLVKGKPGEDYEISSALVIGSGTTLDMTGCTVTLLPSSATNMLKNYAVTATASATDAAVTSGSNVVTTALGASAVVGQTLVVAGAGGNGNGPLVGQISARTATTITLVKLDGVNACNASATVSGAAVSLYTRDTDISILGGVWERGNNAGTGVGLHSLLLRHIDSLTVDIESIRQNTVGKYGVAPGDVRNARVRVRNCLVTSGTPCQFNGPLYNVHVEEVAGSALDDLLAFTAGDYTTYQDVAGDMYNVTVDNVRGTSTGANLLKVLAGAGRIIDGFKVTGEVNGVAALNCAWVGDDTNSAATTGGTYGQIDLGTISAIPGSASNTVVLISPAVDRVRVRIKETGAGGQSNCIRIAGTSTATIGVLQVDGSDWVITNKPSDLVNFNASNVTVNELLIDGCRVSNGANDSLLLHMVAGTLNHMTIRSHTHRGSTSKGYLVYQDAGTISTIHVIGGTFSSGNNLYRCLGGTCATLIIDGAVISGYGRLAQCSVNGQTLTVVLHDPIVTSTTAGMFYVSSASLVVYGSITAIASQTLVQRAASESVRVNGPTLPADLSILTPANGDLAFNTNAALGPLAGPAVYQTTAAKWKGLYSGLTT